MMNAKRLLTALLTVAMILSAIVFTVSADTRNPGDVNGDGRINVADYTLVKRHVLRTLTLNEEQQVGADVNGDGRINVADYTLVKRHVLGTYVIGGPAVEKTAIDKIVDKIGKKDKISIDYEGEISEFYGKSTISFEMIGGVLNLHGHAITEEGLMIDLYVPMAKIAAEYAFNGDAKMTVGTQTISGEAVGVMVAADYSIFETKFKSLEFTSTMTLDAMQEKMVKKLCKEAMDQFLFQANNLLEQENVGVTIADLGFTTFYQEIEEGLLG